MFSVFSTGENGCSQGNLNRKLRGYGSLEARHLCRKVEKAKIVKVIFLGCILFLVYRS